jgi:hypothetical protein
MVAEEVFVNCYNFNPFRVKHASFHVKKYQYSLTQGKKGNFQDTLVSYKTIRNRGRSTIRICCSVAPEPKKYFRLYNSASFCW